MDPQDIRVGSTEDGIGMRIEVGDDGLDLSYSDAEALLIMLSQECDRARTRQINSGLLPTKALDHSLRVLRSRVLIGQKTIGLQLDVADTSTLQPRSLILELDADDAVEIGSRLVEKAGEARQRRRPS